MSEAATLEEVLSGLEQAIARLADGGAPLEQLVADYEQAARLLANAEVLLGAARTRIAEAQ